MAFLERSIRLELTTNPYVPGVCHRLHDSCVNYNADKNFEFWPGRREMIKYSGGRSNLFRYLKTLLRLGIWEKVDRKEMLVKPGPNGPQAYPCQVYRVVYPPPTGGPSGPITDHPLKASGGPLGNNGGSTVETTGGPSGTTGGPRSDINGAQVQISPSKEQIRTSSATRSSSEKDSDQEVDQECPKFDGDHVNTGCSIHEEPNRDCPWWKGRWASRKLSRR